MAAIITLLISLGLIGSPQEFNDLSDEEQQNLVNIVNMEDIDI